MREALEALELARRDRRRDDRDRAARRLRAAGGEPVREVRGDVLQPRVPATTSSTCATRCSSRSRARCPSPRSTRASIARARRRRRGDARRRCAPPRARVAAAYAAALRRRDRRPTRARRRSPPYVLYETLGPTLPEGLAGAAALWGLAHRCAMTYPDAVRRAGHADGDALFDAILDLAARAWSSRSTSTRTTSRYMIAGDRRFTLEIPEMLDGRPRAARDGGRAGPPTSSRSSSRPASAARTPPTTSSATPAGASATRTARCASARRTPSASGLRRRRPRARSRRRAAAPGPSSRSATRCCPATSRCPNGYGVRATGDGRRAGGRGRRAQRPHLLGLARRVRRHAVAQARPGADRSRRGLSVVA